MVFHSDGEMEQTLERLRRQYAAAVARAFDWQGPTQLGLTRSDQFVILLHETAYELFAVLDRSGVVSFPDALRGGGRLSAIADLTSVKLGNEPSADDEAMALYMSNHWHGSPRVVAAFQELVRDQPENTDALFYLGMALYDTQNYDEAIAAFSRLETSLAVEEHTLLDWSRIWIGHCHDALGDREAAMAVFQRVASTADPESTMQFGQYGIGHVRAGDWARRRTESPWRWR
jgi:tetratricopeptide (TPR) repeat protein